MTSHERLSTVLQRLGKLIVDDARAAAVERDNKAAEALTERMLRGERLDREQVPLESAMREAIVRGRLRHTEAALAVRAWVASSRPPQRDKGGKKKKAAPAPPILLLHGVGGSGKSVAAAWAIATSDGGRWFTALNVLSAFGGWHREQHDVRRQLVQCSLLVVDDLGRERTQDASRMALALLELVDARQRRGCRTIITTRMLRAELEARYALEPLTSRLHYCADSVHLEEGDLRPSKPPIEAAR